MFLLRFCRPALWVMPMDQNEFQQLVGRIKSVLNEDARTEKFFFQLMTHDGVHSQQIAVSNLNENDALVIGKSFSRSSELLLMQFREWLTK